MLTMMKRVAAVALIAAASAPVPAIADGGLSVSDAWVRPNLPNRPTAAYFMVENGTGETDRLVSASSPDFERIELHRTVEDGGVMKMEPVDGFEVPAGDQLMLAPGGNHLMLFGAAQTFSEGETVSFTLTFEGAGPIEVSAEISRKGAGMGHMDHSGHGENMHDDHHGSHGHGEHTGSSTE